MGHALRGWVHQNTTTQLPSIALHSFIAYSRSIKSQADVNLYLARQQFTHKFLPVALVAMFITVRFGDDKSELFNPNCRNVILLDNIRERCNCDEDDMIDLSDENGSVANLPGHLDDYGKNFLTDRGSFILVRVERDGDEGDDDRFTYIPLLQGIDDDKDFLSRLNPKPTKGGERGKGRRKGDRSGSPSSAKGDRRKGRQKQESQSRRSGGTASRNTPSKR